MARGFRVANTSANPFLAPWAWLPSHDSCKSFSIFFALVQNDTRNWTPNFWDLSGIHGRFLSLLMYLNLLDSAWLAPRHLTDDLHLNLDHPIIHALLQMELNSKPHGWLTRWTSKCQILQIHSRPYNSLGFFRLQHLAKAQVGNTVSCGVSQQLSAEIHSTWPKLMKLMIQTCILEKEAKKLVTLIMQVSVELVIFMSPRIPYLSQPSNTTNRLALERSQHILKWMANHQIESQRLSRDIFSKEHVGSTPLAFRIFRQLYPVTSVEQRGKWRQVIQKTQAWAPWFPEKIFPTDPSWFPPNSCHPKPTRDF